jgi:hypothetical protein
VVIRCGISIVCNICEELPVKNLMRNEIRLRRRTARQQHAVA